MEKVTTLHQQLVPRALVKELATSGPRKEHVLGGLTAHGLTPIPKIEQDLGLLPRENPKVTERHLKEEEKGKARSVGVPQKKIELNLLLSLLGIHRLRARKTGSLAGITF